MLIKAANPLQYGSYYYPAEHWRRLRRFAIGKARDPRGLFKLTEDKWELWPYAPDGTPARAVFYRINFGHLRTFIKLYVKWYCYHRLLESNGRLNTNLKNITYALTRADTYILEKGFRSVEEVAPSVVFQTLWEAQIVTDVGKKLPLTQSAVATQVNTRPFWLRVRSEFGVPFLVPRVAVHTRAKPAAFAADRSKVIPQHVIRQLSNKLGLHREKKELLPRPDHLRLCVMMLAVCIGRRVYEVFLSPRGAGSDGPLVRLPSKLGSPEGSLWFQFLPNKQGVADKVYVSPEWEDLTLYCVRELVKYSDEVRRHAAPEERGQLILVSPLNSTYGRWAGTEYSGEGAIAIKDSHGGGAEGGTAYEAYGLTGTAYRGWLNGSDKSDGILKSWGITADGSADGPAYKLLLSYTRHTRHNALTLDPQVTSSALQRDLNHSGTDAQFAYQHSLQETNDSLLDKISDGKLMGRGAEWLSEVLGADNRLSPAQSRFASGRPSSGDPRVLALIRGNPAFVRRNRVPGGICVSPLGPRGCAEFVNCTSAAEGGCHCFAVDVGDVQMLHELDSKAAEERRMQRESADAGRVVQSQKRDTQARRTEDLRDEALRRASEETLSGLRQYQSEIEEKGL